MKSPLAYEVGKVAETRGVDVNKRTVTTHSYNLPYGDKQLSTFFLYFWPHLDLD